MAMRYVVDVARTRARRAARRNVKGRRGMIEKLKERRRPYIGTNARGRLDTVKLGDTAVNPSRGVPEKRTELVVK